VQIVVIQAHGAAPVVCDLSVLVISKNDLTQGHQIWYARDDHEALWSGIDSWSERSKVKVTRLETVFSACLCPRRFCWHSL